ncbi:hypothetical protein E2C01_030692 [Portunus trituberculatus]|uniref:Uncharacterized protein n=1 Tax=Portunus trituberculatus TaxID=210409 RepID=A0A5B7EVZ1_PORTR|nr:hypothetical protein [Portunus trituberculatus]
MKERISCSFSLSCRRMNGGLGNVVKVNCGKPDVTMVSRTCFCHGLKGQGDECLLKIMARLLAKRHQAGVVDRLCSGGGGGGGDVGVTTDGGRPPLSSTQGSPGRGGVKDTETVSAHYGRLHS